MDNGTDTTTVTPDDTTEAGLDIDAAADSISTDLFGPDTAKAAPTEPAAAEEPEPAATAEAPAAPAPTDQAAAVAPPAQAPAVTAAEAPKAWPREMHEHWGKLDPKVQEYLRTREKQMLDGLEQYKGDAVIGKGFKEVVGPYVPHLKAAGIQPEQMVGNLLNAHWRLTQGPVESRKAAYEELGRNLGFVQADPNAPAVDPAVLSLRNELNEVKSALTERQRLDYETAMAQFSKEVDTFASDTAAHPYFDEVADDIVALLKAYPKLSLQDAYDRAVYANPVTREKETAKLRHETEQKLRENARLDALPKKKAAGVNVKGSETARSAPTEPLGSFDETLRSTFKTIKERTH